jgi:hypothetical protein
MDARLAFVDEHLRPVAASVEATWQAVDDSMNAPPAGPAARYARLVGARGGRPFEVAESVPPHRLVLVGEHRFARYSLVLTVDELGPGLTALRAQTWAAFPGALGRLYRAAVIDSRGHVLIVRRMLGSIARRAERGVPAGVAATCGCQIFGCRS